MVHTVVNVVATLGTDGKETVLDNKAYSFGIG